LALDVRLIKPLYVVLGAALILMLLILLFIIFGKRKEYECDRCGERKKARKTRRHSCGGKLKRKR